MSGTTPTRPERAEIERLLELAEKATPGKWKARKYKKGEPQHGYAWIDFAPKAQYGDKNYMYDTSPIKITDAEFIAAARDLLPRLAREVLVLRAIADAARSVLPEVAEAELGSAIAADFDTGRRIVHAKAERWEKLRALLAERTP